MDYRRLLKKYMRLIISEEGIAYLDRLSTDYVKAGMAWSQAEIEELHKIADETDKEQRWPAKNTSI